MIQVSSSDVWYLENHWFIYLVWLFVVVLSLAFFFPPMQEGFCFIIPAKYKFASSF